MDRGIKAPGRRVTPSDNAQFSEDSAKAGSVGSQATYGRGSTQSSLFRTPPKADGRYNEGTIIRSASNIMETGVAGRPALLALRGKMSSKPAVENPDGTPNRPGSRRK